MEILRTSKIEKELWEHIRVSLQECGDIGEFDRDSHGQTSRFLREEHRPILRNLIEMGNKYPKNRYYTTEAASVFTALASAAGERLGLNHSLANIFGGGYSWVRTGSLALDGDAGDKHIIKKVFFYKLFYPAGGFFDWDFDSPIVKRKLGLVFYKFKSWQDEPRSYIQDVKDFREQLEPLWQGLLLAEGFPTIDWSRTYETYSHWINKEI